MTKSFTIPQVRSIFKKSEWFGYGKIVPKKLVLLANFCLPQTYITSSNLITPEPFITNGVFEIVLGLKTLSTKQFVQTPEKN